jgi:AraC-like DNA-binding protein
MLPLKTESPLQRLFELSQEDKPWRICLWDWSGFTRASPELALDFDRFQVHRSPFCEAAKSSPMGLRRCLRCRQAAGAKALRQGPYQGVCHLGVTELVHPVLLGERVLGILFGGQLLGPGRRRLEPAELAGRGRRLGILPRRLARRGAELPRASAAQLRDLKGRLELIAAFISAQLRADPSQSLSSGMARAPVQQEQPSMRGASRRAWLAKSGMEIARLEYHKALSSSRTAARLNVSLSVFCRSFKEHCGRSFKAYLQEQRLVAAERLLIESESALSYIGAEVGFKDPNFFSRAFRRKNGLSPSEFREKHWKLKGARRSK